MRVGKTRAARRFCVFLVFSFLLCALFTAAAAAADDEYGIDDVIAALPAEITGEYGITDEKTLGEKAEEVSGWENIVKLAGKSVGAYAKEAVSSFLPALGILIVAAAAKIMTDGMGEGVSGAVGFCCSLCLLLSLYSSQKEMCDFVGEYLGRLKTLCNGMSFSVCAVYAAGGNAGAASASDGVFTLFLALLENFGTDKLYLVLRVCFCLCAANAMLPERSLTSLISAAGNVFNIVIGALMTLLCASLALQSSIASASDGLLSRTVKYTVSAAVPIVGGAVGDSVRSVAGALSIIRTSLGAVGIAALVVMCLPILISLFLQRAVYLLLSGVAAMLGCHDEGAVIVSMSKLYAMLIALAAAATMTFIFILAVFIGTVPSISL